MQATSAQRKLEWAFRNLRRLAAEVEDYTKSRRAYAFHAVPDRRSAQQIDYRCYATESEAPDPDWPLLAGDVIQSLRAALDHLVWAATPESERNTSTAFPIFTDPTRFQASGASKCATVPRTDAGDDRAISALSPDAEHAEPGPPRDPP